MSNDRSQDWCQTFLSECVDSLDAGTSVNSEDRPHGSGEIGVLKTSAVSGGKFHANENKAVNPSEKIHASEPVRGGSILISRMNTPDLVGESCFVAEDWPELFLPDRLWQVKANDSSRINMKWLAYILQGWHARQYIKRNATGTSGSMKNLAKSRLLAMPISLPSPSEQNRIAEILETLEAQIHAVEQIVAKLKFTRKGMINDLLGKDWILSSVDEQFEIKSGITLGPHRLPKDDASGYLRVANVQRGAIRMAEVARLQASPSERQGYRLAQDDLLIVEGHADINQIGRCARVGDEAAGLLYQNHLFRLRPRTMNAVFAEAWLNSQYAMDYWRATCTSSSGLNTINSRQLKNMLIAVPPYTEQLSIASIIDQYQRRMDSEVEGLEKLHALKEGLMEDLLSGRVRVPVETSV
ncbi:restriction endonuclease subunit S [Glycomyces sp. NPDC047010]|uniref:restriction endonuclease subunit S n=1 Tax=Glycomyces sp. NPDC047010 TaxID=3155023 RepID=UPI0033FD12D1